MAKDTLGIGRDKMAESVVLDAMIMRDDFAVQGPKLESSESIRTLSIENLTASGMIVPLLRKPDFQRETNHWTSKQILSFLESFLDNELIPSIILWKSDSFVFVIDGGHRLSALRSWIEDDYGDGLISNKYFSNQINVGQKKVAAATRKLVEERIGKYSAIKDALINQDGHTADRVRRARNMAMRSLDLQWVNGDSEKAETSFFKINTQGTPLDKSEELLLRNRHRSVAIAARSIVRAATGHKYWSKFLPDTRSQIEQNAKFLHHALFNPEVDNPIKTLDLPLGGSKSPINALELLMSLIAVTNGRQGISKKDVKDFEDDPSGEKTIEVLRDCARVVERVSGNNAASLGLHPAVYFYSERGRHIPDLLIGILLLFRKKIENNDSSFFKRFIQARGEMESYLVENKGLITQALQLARSAVRFERVAALYEFLIDEINAGRRIDDEKMITVVAPGAVSKILAVAQNSVGQSFSADAKSTIFLRQSLQGAMKCSICSGYLDPTKSASFDHIVRKQEGGLGSANNGQIVHPYCNTGIKN
ncbi:MAG: DUF262 domain-containing protein [Mesorhizobium sp.]|nr:MAG: DUF262 domain-containing protein [Mesorhizobium sp.]